MSREDRNLPWSNINANELYFLGLKKDPILLYLGIDSCIFGCVKID